MTRVFLAAGVAALAIAVPATAGPHGDKGARADRQQAQMQRAGRVQMRAERQQARPQRAERIQMRAERQQARPQRAERIQMRAERQQARPQRAERVQMRAERQKARPQRVERQTRLADRQQMRAQRQQARPQRMERQQMRADRAQKMQNRQAFRVDRGDLKAQRQAMRFDRQAQQQALKAQRQDMRFDRQVQRQELRLARQEQLQALRSADARAFQTSSIQLITPRTRILAPTEAVRYIGAPVSTVTNYVPLMALPQSVSYLYPATNDYYYRYGSGYVYQVDRTSNLIAALLPLLAGGILPGTYLPSSYMNSYVPDYYGLNSFYPSSYGYNPYAYNAGYGYGYGSSNLCNRYANGVIYQVDCITGLVENVIPMYAAGYGVGQMLPSSYSTYNVPYQYRSMYYNTPDYGYYYAPGAIYQYDPSSSLITSVAALLTPGFSIGQPLPAGYGMYNVPMAYRSTYYDTPNAWYRYNNGYIYQVDPTTQLVTAIVASLLT